MKEFSQEENDEIIRENCKGVVATGRGEGVVKKPYELVDKELKTCSSKIKKKNSYARKKTFLFSQQEQKVFMKSNRRKKNP